MIPHFSSNAEVIRRTGGLEDSATKRDRETLVIRRTGGLEVPRLVRLVLRLVIRRTGGLEDET